MEIHFTDPAAEGAAAEPVQPEPAQTIVVEASAALPARTFNWNALLLGLVMLTIGASMLIWPMESSSVLSYVIAGMVAALGAARTILYFVRREHAQPFSFGGLPLGLTLLALGALLLCKPVLLTAILSVALGCLLIFSGFGSLQTAIDLIRIKLKYWYVPMLFALLSIACGVLTLLDPFETADTLMVFLGIALAGEGALLLASAFLFSRK